MKRRHSNPASTTVTFTTDDLRSAERLERVLRQFQSAVQSAATTGPALPDPAQLAQLLAPFIRDALQARGSAPLNLQSLLPTNFTGIPIVDTHANRLTLYPASNYVPGQPFFESDRTVWYVVTLTAGVLAWTYAGGICHTTLAARPTDLATADQYFLLDVTDYSHTLQWSGSAWGWGPDDDGSDYYRMYQDAPAGFGANAWQVCDGSTVDRLNPDGTTSSVTVPDVTTAVYLKGGLTAAAIAAAGGTTANTTATNQNESAHTHAVTSPTGAPSATTTVDNDGAGSTVAVGSATHTHAVTSPTGAGSAHTHIQDAHNHGPGSLELRNKQTALYYRR